MRFYLGTHRPHWLGLIDVPLFVSRRVLYERKSFPRARASWCLDSGGYTELNMNGKWSITTEQYAEEVARFSDGIGRLEWCAPMDWMCEQSIRDNTGLSVREHQHRTVANYLDLHDRLGDVVIPVLQGYKVGEYLDCVALYHDAGVDLQAASTVGVGSICRRGKDREINAILAELRAVGLTNMHAFGVRGKALNQNLLRLQSADSMAWSARARRQAPMSGHQHKSCANCLEYALAWRVDLLSKAGRNVRTTIDMLEMTA